MKAQKAGERQSVGDLILELLVTEIEEALNDQGFEHQNHIQRLAPSRAFALRVSKSLGQNGTKHLKINMLFQFFQRVFQATQCGKALTFIKQGDLV